MDELLVLQVIVVPWVSRMYGICTLRAVQIPYTLETHGTGDLYHNTITNAVSYDKR